MSSNSVENYTTTTGIWYVDMHPYLLLTGASSLFFWLVHAGVLYPIYEIIKIKLLKRSQDKYDSVYVHTRHIGLILLCNFFYMAMFWTVYIMAAIYYNTAYVNPSRYFEYLWYLCWYWSWQENNRPESITFLIMYGFGAMDIIIPMFIFTFTFKLWPKTNMKSKAASYFLDSEQQQETSVQIVEEGNNVDSTDNRNSLNNVLDYDTALYNNDGDIIDDSNNREDNNINDNENENDIDNDIDNNEGMDITSSLMRSPTTNNYSSHSEEHSFEQSFPKEYVKDMLVHGFIVVAHNSSIDIIHCIRHILVHVEPWQLFIADNGSTAEERILTAQVCVDATEEYKKAHPDYDGPNVNISHLNKGNKTWAQYAVLQEMVNFRVKVIEEKNMSNLPSCINCVTLLDDDVMWPSTWSTEKCNKLLSDKQTVALAYPLYAENGDSTIWSRFQDCEYLLGDSERFFQEAVATNLFCSGAAATWRADVLKNILDRHDTVFNGEDLEMGYLTHKLSGRPDKLLKDVLYLDTEEFSSIYYTQNSKDNSEHAVSDHENIESLTNNNNSDNNNSDNNKTCTNNSDNKNNNNNNDNNDTDRNNNDRNNNGNNNDSDNNSDNDSDNINNNTGNSNYKDVSNNNNNSSSDGASSDANNNNNIDDDDDDDDDKDDNGDCINVENNDSIINNDANNEMNYSKDASNDSFRIINSNNVNNTNDDISNINTNNEDIHSVHDDNDAIMVVNDNDSENNNNTNNNINIENSNNDNHDINDLISSSKVTSIINYSNTIMRSNETNTDDNNFNNINEDSRKEIKKAYSGAKIAIVKDCFVPTLVPFCFAHYWDYLPNTPWLRKRLPERRCMYDCPEASLFAQRFRSWDPASHSFMFRFAKIAFSPGGWTSRQKWFARAVALWKVVGLSREYLYVITVLLFIGRNPDNIQFLFLMTFDMILIWWGLFVLVQNLVNWILLRRCHLQVRPETMTLFPCMFLLIYIVYIKPIVAFYNIFYYFPCVRWPGEIRNEMKNDQQLREEVTTSWDMDKCIKKIDGQFQVPRNHACIDIDDSLSSDHVD